MKLPMQHTATSLLSASAAPGLRVPDLPNNLAFALVGQTVSVRGRGNTIFHGVVAGVLTGTGRPRLVVDRTSYDLNQILSVTPTVLN